MKVISNKTLVYWKEAQLAVREQLNELKKTLKYAKRKVKYYEGKARVGLVLLLLIFVGGCCTIKGAFEDLSWGAGQLAENIETENK